MIAFILHLSVFYLKIIFFLINQIMSMLKNRINFN